MKFTLKKPCHECPYLSGTPGWVGPHDPIDFHHMVIDDIPMPCHKTVPEDSGDFFDVIEQDGQHCVGYALYMNKQCKRSRDPQMLAMQQRMRDEPPDLDGRELVHSFDGSALVKLHRS